MDFNRTTHPDCVYSDNPFHECASACLENIAKGHVKKNTKKQSSKFPSFSRSFGRKKKESHSQPLSPLSSRSSQNGDGGLANRNSPKLHHFIASPVALKTKTVSEFEGGDKTRLFSLLDLPTPHETSDDDDDENNNEIGIELDLESVMSETFVSVGNYQVRSGLSTILSTIIEKHGDIAQNCKLKSDSMRSHYLDCLCTLMQELRSTPVKQLTKVKVNEMLSILKDLESVNIEVTWLCSVLEEFALSLENVETEKEKQDGLVKAKREELETQEADLVRMEKEVVEARLQLEETRIILVGMEKERSKMDKMGFKTEKFKGKMFIDELL